MPLSSAGSSRCPPEIAWHGHMVPHRSVPRFFSLSLAATVERLLHPYRVVLSRVDFWEASGTGLSARRRRQLAKSTLETRRITGKPSSPFASHGRKLAAAVVVVLLLLIIIVVVVPIIVGTIFHFAFVRDPSRSGGICSKHASFRVISVCGNMRRSSERNNNLEISIIQKFKVSFFHTFSRFDSLILSLDFTIFSLTLLYFILLICNIRAND